MVSANETAVASPSLWTRGKALRDARASVRLGTLNNLRWLAVVGQAVALVVVRLGLNFDFPLLLAASPIAASAVMNIVLAIAYPAAKRLTAQEATAFLAYDIVQLAALLFFTGGIENPFALLFLAPVVISAATLDVASTLLLGALSFVAIMFLWRAHLPLPWSPVNSFRLPPLYQTGIWVSLLLGIGFTSIYAWRIASEGTRMAAALSATQMALAREHRLASLGALAAAAAHELGTPLGTIAVVAHELARELASSPHADDFRLLRGEAERCRAILARLAQPEEAVLGQTERLPLGALLDDIAAPHRGVDVTISLDMQSGAPPRVWRVPEILHGLGNLIENAADFASSTVRLRARWDANLLSIEVVDDGPGFAAEIFEQIGEPYITSRPSRKEPNHEPGPGIGKQEGMGLGFFIAKTLIEQTGGTVSARNRAGGGAVVTVTWPRGAVDGESPPRQDFHL
ncbi:MAG TPA: ActS/PrrB/RegB family redox-sensitive histidine kinase [Micropepsaceae bacterium]|nr:ActS/PrrB/RegB family redox-sensitive histidine kinase [Micropepsaceae bacterium]